MCPILNSRTDLSTTNTPTFQTGWSWSLYRSIGKWRKIMQTCKLLSVLPLGAEHVVRLLLMYEDFMITVCNNRKYYSWWYANVLIQHEICRIIIMVTPHTHTHTHAHTHAHTYGENEIGRQMGKTKSLKHNKSVRVTGTALEDTTPCKPMLASGLSWTMRNQLLWTPIFISFWIDYYQLAYRAAMKLLHPCLSLASFWMVPQLWFMFSTCIQCPDYDIITDGLWTYSI